MAPPRQFARHPFVRLSEPADTKLTRIPGSSPSRLTSFQYPYILTQGTTDQPRIEHALLDIAIQFEETPQ